ncbi:lanthionine synthetase C family protein [Clostridium kluyveri]|uniref:lanthionine synthetase C family protein n=1 Tax=Clostridium kluyveri TaxID=1534 RepID=UPI002AFE3D83|nr:lanthionine synthetase C family protein [Clostridium kluyveri]
MCMGHIINLGLSHGITGPLAALTIALKEGIEIRGQYESIKKILKNLKMFSFMDNKENIYWLGRVKFEKYIGLEQSNNYKSRASWCYGAPGIARVMYLAGETINDKDSTLIAIKSLEAICKMDENEWKLESPTFCHGYSGLLAIIQAMYIDTNNNIFGNTRKKILDKIISLYNKNALLGFYNIDVDEKNYFKKEYQLVKSNNIFLLSGSIGVILTLLSLIKPINTNWMRHFLIR